MGHIYLNKYRFGQLYASENDRIHILKVGKCIMYQQMCFFYFSRISLNIVIISRYPRKFKSPWFVSNNSTYKHLCTRTIKH